MDERTTAPRGAAPGTLVAPLLTLLGPVVALLAVTVLSGGQPFPLLREGGVFALGALLVAGVATLGSAGVVASAARGRPRLVALVAPLALVGSGVAQLGWLLGVGQVSAALAGAAPEHQHAMAAAGGSELMALRGLSACLVFGHALALSGAWLALRRARGRAPDEPTVAGLGALTSLGVAGVALASAVDAGSLRTGLDAVRASDHAQLTQPLTDALLSANATHLLLLGAVTAGGVVGLACAASALRSGVANALAVLSPCLVGLFFAGGDALLLARTADALAQGAPWGNEPDFAPLVFRGASGLAHTPTCVAAAAGVRCGDGRAGAYAQLGEVIPGVTRVGVRPYEALPDEDADEGEPSLSVAIDGRLDAPALRSLLEAAATAGYASLVVVGAWTPPAFGDGAVPAMLRGQVPRTEATRWLLRTVSPAVVARSRPAVVVVADGDTSASVMRRVTAAPNAHALVAPGPLAPVPADPSTAPTAETLNGAVEASPPPGTALDPATISRVVRAHTAAMRRCYEQGLRVQPALAGRIDVRFTILADGQVSAVSGTSAMEAPGVIACVETEVGRLTFPPGPGRDSATVVYPLLFGANR